jgi:hypothetical protein
MLLDTRGTGSLKCEPTETEKGIAMKRKTPTMVRLVIGETRPSGTFVTNEVLWLLEAVLIHKHRARLSPRVIPALRCSLLVERGPLILACGEPLAMS